MADNMKALSAFATAGASNLTEAVNYYSGLKALLVKDTSRFWYQSDEKNQFGDNEFYATQSKLEEIRDAYFESLIHNKAPRKTFTAWLVPPTAPSVFASNTHMAPRPSAQPVRDGESKDE